MSSGPATERLVVITGLSGSGKTLAADCFEVGACVVVAFDALFRTDFDQHLTGLDKTCDAVDMTVGLRVIGVTG